MGDMVFKKACSRCREYKPYTDFYRDKKAKDGMTYYCKQCKKEHQSEYYKTESGNSSIKQAVKRYYNRKKESVSE